MATVQSIFRYPVKSFPGENLKRVDLVAGEGLPEDRRYAITNGISNTMNGAWLTCRSFFINSTNDGLLKFAVNGDHQNVHLRAPDGTSLSWRKGDEASLEQANRSLAHFIAPLKPDPNLPPPIIVERTQLPGMLSGYWDFDDSAVSLMNLASLQAVSDAVGEPLDLRRLRGNLYLDAMPAWEEFSLLGKRVNFGSKGAEMEILRPVMRCPATAVNPETGERDISVANALSQHFGHAYCGVYAKIVKSGTLSTDDTLQVIGDAKTPFLEAANPADSDPRQWPKSVELVEAQLEPTETEGRYRRLISIRATGPWPLPEASPGQRFRFHLGADRVGVATVREQRDLTTVMSVEPSITQDPATAHLIEGVKPGEQLIVSGPFGKAT